MPRLDTPSRFFVRGRTFRAPFADIRVEATSGQAEQTKWDHALTTKGRYHAWNTAEVGLGGCGAGGNRRDREFFGPGSGVRFRRLWLGLWPSVRGWLRRGLWWGLRR